MARRWRESDCKYPRMLPALHMMVDAGVDEGCLEAFVRLEHADGDRLTAEDWWLRMKIFAIDWNEARGTFERSEMREKRPDDGLDADDG